MNTLPALDEKIRLELVELPKDNGDHAFCIVNRKEGSDIHNIAEWGDAYIVDSWTNEVYSIKDIDKHWVGNRILHNLTFLESTHEGFLGDTFNDQVHSSEWQRTGKPAKSWKPENLYSMDPLPRKPEKIPFSYQKFYKIKKEFGINPKFKFSDLPEIRKEHILHTINLTDDPENLDAISTIITWMARDSNYANQIVALLKQPSTDNWFNLKVNFSSSNAEYKIKNLKNKHNFNLSYAEFAKAHLRHQDFSNAIFCFL